MRCRLATWIGAGSPSTRGAPERQVGALCTTTRAGAPSALDHTSPRARRAAPRRCRRSRRASARRRPGPPSRRGSKAARSRDPGDRGVDVRRAVDLADAGDARRRALERVDEGRRAEELLAVEQPRLVARPAPRRRAARSRISRSTPQARSSRRRSDVAAVLDHADREHREVGVEVLRRDVQLEAPAVQRPGQRVETLMNAALDPQRALVGITQRGRADVAEDVARVGMAVHRGRLRRDPGEERRGLEVGRDLVGHHGRAQQQELGRRRGR